MLFLLLIERIIKQLYKTLYTYEYLDFNLMKKYSKYIYEK